MKHSALLSLACLLPLWVAAQPVSSDLQPDPAVTWGQLDNGLDYAIMPNAEPPGKVSLRLLVKAGSLMEREDQRGLAHFLEHMAFNGSKHYPPGSLVEYLQRIGMSFGADTNAHTGFDETVYKLELPGNTDALLKEGFQVLSDYAGELLLGEEEINHERGVILSELRARDSVDYRTFVANWEFLFPDSLLPQRLPIGLEKVIEGAPRTAFVDFYTDWYRPDNLAVVVVGDVTPEQVEPLLKAAFGPLKNPETPLSEPDLGTVGAPGLHTTLHSEPEAPATVISIESLRPYSKPADSADVRIGDIQAAAASRILTRRFEKLAKEPDAPFSEGAAYAYDYLDFFELGGVEMTCRPEQWQAALTVAEQELRRALQYGFTPAEVDEIKADLLKGYERAVQEAPTRLDRSLSSAIVRSLSRDEVFTSPQTDLELAQAAMADFGPAEALAALRLLWTVDNRYVFVSGNLELGADDPTIEDVFMASAAADVQPPEMVEAKPWPYTDFGPAGEVVKERTVEDLDIHQVVFANNVRFNFKQTDFEAGSVSVAVRFGGGKLTSPADQPGLAEFTGMVFAAGGLEKLSADELQQTLAGKDVGLGFDVDTDAFLLSGNCSPADFTTQVQLLAAALTEPGYREEAARLARQQYAEVALRLDHTMEGVMGNQVSRFLADGSRFFGMPDKEQFDARTMEEVKAWLAQPLADAYLEISVVGDIDYETALKAVAATFGALPKRADAPAADIAERESVAFPTGVTEKNFPYATDIPRAAAVVYWPTVDFWDIERTRRLNVLSYVLADRLRVEVREKLGEGYSPYARNISSETFKDYGYLFALNICAPDKAQELAVLLDNLGKDLGTGNVTEDETERAIKPILNMLKDYLRTNGYWLNRVLLRSQEKPQVLEWARTISSDYNAISVDELNELTREYLGDTEGLKVTVVPEKK
ncbi:M16 family metallopeptidase [Ruficoccus sp. ZRK36]|uniref:M16 family metallopeptidase n=1 Tax=Ruficoccus sp. ZRK36 TaxID=2866311 RepID=UPI001C72C0C2|nr:M16 family metallopeptidase [Ruficoccus sp. ZRK36]QYY36205.1 insulinase family protein [Ruficoccus sp. ZRK36]